jgi:flagellar biosynthesis protein FlhA
LIRAVDPSVGGMLVERSTGRQSLLDVFSKTTSKLAEDLVPNLLSFDEVLKVMRNPLRASVSTRDLRTLFEALPEAAPSTRDPERLTELVRQKLSRQLTSTFRGSDGRAATLIPDPTGIVITKLDETDQVGGVMHAPLGSQLPITYLCDGARVPEDIHDAAIVRVLDAIFPEQA